ncbi:MAG: hypothetical protein ABI128_09190 [Rhodanobacter sp.]
MWQLAGSDVLHDLLVLVEFAGWKVGCRTSAVNHENTFGTHLTKRAARRFYCETKRLGTLQRTSVTTGNEDSARRDVRAHDLTLGAFFDKLDQIVSAIWCVIFNGARRALRESTRDDPDFTATGTQVKPV